MYRERERRQERERYPSRYRDPAYAEKKRQQSREWTRLHPERAGQNGIRWRRKNRDYLNEYWRDYRQRRGKDPVYREQINRRRREYLRSHPKQLERRRWDYIRWRRENAEYDRERSLRWQKNNTEKVRDYRVRRLISGKSKISPAEWPEELVNTWKSYLQLKRIWLQTTSKTSKS